MHELKLKGLRHGGGSHRRNFDPLPRGALSRPCKLAVERSCQPMSANVFNHIWTSAVFAHGSSAHTTAVDMWMNDTGNLNLQGDTAQRPNQTETRKLRRRRFWPAGGLWDLRRFGAIWGGFRGGKWPVYRRLIYTDNGGPPPASLVSQWRTDTTLTGIDLSARGAWCTNYGLIIYTQSQVVHVLRVLELYILYYHT